MSLIKTANRSHSCRSQSARMCLRLQLTVVAAALGQLWVSSADRLVALSSTSLLGRKCCLLGLHASQLAAVGCKAAHCSLVPTPNFLLHSHLQAARAACRRRCRWGCSRLHPRSAWFPVLAAPQAPQGALLAGVSWQPVTSERMHACLGLRDAEVCLSLLRCTQSSLVETSCLHQSLASSTRLTHGSKS